MNPVYQPQKNQKQVTQITLFLLKSMRLMLFSLFALFASSSYAMAGSMSGTVTDSSGNGIENAYVSVSYFKDNSYWADAGSANTDSEGNYKIFNLDERKYRLLTFGPSNQIPEYYDNVDITEENSATLIDLKSNEDKTGVNIELLNRGNIVGTVKNTKGEFLPNVRIKLYYKPEYDPTIWELHSDTIINNNKFTFNGLNSGIYRLKVFDENGNGYEYFDNAAKLSLATDIKVMPEQDNIINIVLGDIGTGSISGKAIDSISGNKINDLNVLLEYKDGDTWQVATSSFTDDKGDYSFVGLFDNEYRVTFRAPGYRTQYYKDAVNIESTTPIILNGNNKENVNAQMVKLGNIKGVIEFTEQYISGSRHVIAFLKDGENWNLVRITDARPRNYNSLIGLWDYDFKGLEAGTYRLQIRGTVSFDYSYGTEFYKDEITLENATDVEIALGDEKVIDMVFGAPDKLPRGIIDGTVTDSDGNPLKNVEVLMYEKNATSDWTEQYDGEIRVKTDLAGKYKFQGIEDGTYRLKFADLNGLGFEYYENSATLIDAKNIVVNRGDDHQIDIVLGGAETVSISGKVTDITGNPVENMGVYVSNKEGAFGGSSVTDADGNYKISGLPPSYYFINFTGTIDDKNVYKAKYNGSILVDEDISNINAQLEKLGAIRGVIKDSLGHVQANVNVTLFEYDEDVSSWYVWGPTSTEGKGQTDINGRFSFTGLWPSSSYQRYRLKVENSDTNYIEYYKDASTLEAANDINVTLGQVTLLNIYLGVSDDQPESLNGIVKDSTGNPLANISVKAYQSNDGDWSTVADSDFIAETFTQADGNYAFEGLVDGTYRIKFDYASLAASRFKLAAKGSLNLARLEGTGIEYYKDATSLAEATDIVIADGQATTVNDVIIGASDDKPEVAVSAEATDGTATEAPGDTGLFTISRTGDTSTALTVMFILRGTAENGKDYKKIGDSITIPAGQSSAVLEIVPINDNLINEADETVIILLDPDTTNQQGRATKQTKSKQLAALVTGGTATITIINNATAQAIPTLQQWAIILLIILLFMISWQQSKMRKQQHL